MLKILKRIEHAFFDRDGRNEYDEFSQPVALVKFVDGTEINQRLACAGFHLDADVILGRKLRVGFGYSVFGNDLLFVFLNLRGREVSDVGLDSKKVGVVEGILHLPIQNRNRRGDGAALVFQVFELNLHRAIFSERGQITCVVPES